MNDEFVSVSGVTKDLELGWIADIQDVYDLDFQIAVGFQVSNKSIHERSANARQPKFLELGYLDMLARRYGLVPAIHYYTKDNETILGDLEIIADSIDMTLGPTLLQFNTLPASNDVLRKAKEMGFDNIFALAVADKKNGGYAVWKGDDVQDVSSGDVAPLIEQAKRVAPFVSYLLFDPSHGTNLGLDLGEENLAIRFGKGVRELKEMDNIGLVYAGGIGPNNVFDVVKILGWHFPEGTSIDIESKVRNSSNQLDRGNVERYLVNVGNAKKL